MTSLSLLAGRTVGAFSEAYGQNLNILNKLVAMRPSTKRMSMKLFSEKNEKRGCSLIPIETYARSTEL